jgi:DNA-binding IclR family transcriptional regulator
MIHYVDHVVSGVGTLDKAMYLLDIVEYSQPITFNDLVERAQFPKTTAHRLLAALEIHGFLRRDSSGRLFTGSRFSTGVLSQIAEPILEQLTAETTESTQLYVRRGEYRLCIVSAESREELRTKVPVGSLLVINRGSGGKVLSGDPVALKRGWAESVGERVPGIASVSAPIYDAGIVVAAVSLSGPIERLGPSPGARFGKKVVSAANRIQHALATSHR